MRINPTHSAYQQGQWHLHGTRQRLFSASLAVLITLFLSHQFNYRSIRKSEDDILSRPFTLLTFQIIPTSASKAKDQAHIEKSPVRKSTAIPIIGQHPANVSDSPTEIKIDVTQPHTTEQAVTLLPINSKTIAKAYNESKSEIQKMAEASGKELNTPIKTKYDKFQTAAEEAVIPDCLSPQGPGGIGLFAIPVIAFAAATGKCK